MTKTELFDFDIAEYLHDPETAASYLKGCIEEGGVALLQKGIGDVARAFGMSEVAVNSGLTRASLYKALSESGSPALSTIDRVLASLGFRLSIEVVGEASGKAFSSAAVKTPGLIAPRVIADSPRKSRIVGTASATHSVAATHNPRSVTMSTKSSKGSKVLVGNRSAKTGEFVTPAFAKKNPSTTIKERSKVAAKPKK